MVPLHCFIADVRLRDLYSVDWCATHPDGSVGEFNYDWDNLDEKVRNVRLIVFLTRLSSHIFTSFLGVQRKGGGEEDRVKGEYKQSISLSTL